MTENTEIKELQLKQCTGCKEIKPLSEFWNRKRNKNGKNARCAKCARKTQKKGYDKAKKKRLETKQNRKKRNARFKWEYLSRHPCVDCGESDPVVLVFDHVDGHQKLATISEMVYGCHSIKAIKKEIAKCEVRCANCHTRRHFLERLELGEAMLYDGTSGQDD